MFKKLLVISAATFMVVGLAACNDVKAQEETPHSGLTQSEEATPVPEVTKEGSQETEEPEDSSASTSSGGFVHIEMDQAEIDRLDAEGALIEITNPEDVNHVKLRDSSQGYLEVKIEIRGSELQEFYNKTGDEPPFIYGYEGDPIYPRDLGEWLTQAQIDGLECEAGSANVPVIFELGGLSEKGLAATHIEMDSVGFYMVSPSCAREPINRRSTMSNVFVVGEVESKE